MDGTDKLNLLSAPAGTPWAPRIAPLGPRYAADVAAALYGIHPSHSPREPLKLFRTMVKSLGLCDPMFAFARFMLGRNTATAASYDLRTRELLIDRIMARCGCEYEWGVHMAAYGEKAGITPAQVYSLVRGDYTDVCWTDEDRATMTFVDELHDHGRVSDATWAAMRVRFSEATLIELLVLVRRSPPEQDCGAMQRSLSRSACASTSSSAAASMRRSRHGSRTPYGQPQGRAL
jgi:alkylhydroperoxidase family enzyme